MNLERVYNKEKNALNAEEQEYLEKEVFQEISKKIMRILEVNKEYQNIYKDLKKLDEYYSMIDEITQNTVKKYRLDESWAKAARISYYIYIHDYSLYII